MKILVINAGSSSLKYQLIDMDNEQMLAKGNCEKIGLEMGIFGHKTADGREKKIEIPLCQGIFKVKVLSCVTPFLLILCCFTVFD